MALNGRLRVAVDGDRVVLLDYAVPLAAWFTAGDSGPELWLVGSAASLLAGDRCRLELQLLGRSRLTVRSTAAQLAYPSRAGESRWDVSAEVAPGSALTWSPEPLVACAGSRYVGRAEVNLGHGATLLWRDEISLGRRGEDPQAAAVRSTVTVSAEGRTVLSDGLDTSAPGAFGPAVLGSSRYVGCVYAIGHPMSDPADGIHQLGDIGAWAKTVDGCPADGRAWLERRARLMGAVHEHDRYDVALPVCGGAAPVTDPSSCPASLASTAGPVSQ